ncbi:MAG: hypothetical protein LKJ48_06235 [Lactobacillus sp.]|jgi:hypothetical protein|nr:hypothetical protein [Lactobacillus sp.]
MEGKRPKVNDLSISIEKFIKSGFKDDDALNESLKLYESLDDEKQQLFEENMYTIFRGKFDACYTSAQYVEALRWLSKTKENPRFARELSNNKAHFLVEAVKSLLMAYLENDDKKLLNSAMLLAEDVEFSDLENDALRETFDENQAIMADVKQESLWTKTFFSVPIAMKTIENEMSMDVPYKDECLHAVVSVQSEGMNGNSANVSKVKDRDSVIGSTLWTVCLNKYLSCEATSEGDDTASVMQFYVCNVVNRIIDAYKAQTGEYWVKNIYPAMISGHSIEYGIGNKTIRNVLFYDRSEYHLSTKPASIILGTEFIKDSIPLYKSLLMEAKSYLLAESFRESVISLNSAFENFTYTVVCPSIVANSSGMYVENFYLKVQPYQEYFLHDYLTEEGYADAVRKGIVKARGMSTYAIYKVFYNVLKNYVRDFSKTKLNGLISVIRDNRNDLTHGKTELTTMSTNRVKQQISAFEELISFITDTNANAHRQEVSNN